ncbi:hypothetical protein ACFFLZ_00210 [Photobacterium aphoticum]|uniref:Sucrose phosphatase-like domain-containing protein n=1 Tax=Photobacterium aphoticum TaxID=754436 RepID=A0A0J1GFH2_9GAMM|nr:hypothetical protein [Photobacterium aphoticum]KLU98457.1 hypothetical protein ABT58_22460 [Photobacterium aphoticum]GHA63607.1 hypothetical protein GCM10007086_41880 [Photobacterium aphoticum]
MTKPLFLVDLDDNLFQTQRKMTQKGQTPAETAALDRALKPRSFFSQEQANFVHWLLEHADVIPVTARGTEETARVTIPFTSWKVMTHGAVITMPDDQPDPQWQDQIQTALIPYQQQLHDRQAALTAAFNAANIDAWARINFEYDGQAIYLVAKHTDSSKIDELYAVADQVDRELGTDGFYIHRNDNNIAWLPHCIEKGKATRYLIDKLRADEPHKPIIGLGDSLSDMTFLRQCSWFGMPPHSQLSKPLLDFIDAEHGSTQPTTTKWNNV